MQKDRNLAEYAIVLNRKDNVATAMVDVPEGDYVVESSETAGIIHVRHEIKAGFKVAISRVRQGDRVYKYGHTIGIASVEICPGDCVHVHNMVSGYSS